MTPNHLMQPTGQKRPAADYNKNVSRTAMPLSHYALDAFVSQELSKLTSCAPQSLASEFPERS